MLAKLDHLKPLRSVETTRRGFLLGASAVAGGLVIGYSPLVRASTDGTAGAATPFDAYIRIDADNTITVLSSQFDMGQGAYHGLATLVVEELNADWSTINVVGASGNPALYGNIQWGGQFQGSGGSTSMATSFDRYRKAGATARVMLVNAAAKAWGVPPGEVRAENSMLSHTSGKRATFGEMAASAAEETVPQDVALKDRADWTTIGDAAGRRYDSASKTDGSHTFTIDVKLPGMLTAVMIHPPKFGATVKSFDAAEAKAMKGVVDVVATPRGVAVVAQHMWAAMKARDTVTVDWDETQAEQRGTAEIMEEYRTKSTQTPIANARREGDVAAAFAQADKTVEATYEFPFLAHAAMEPLNAIARMNDDGTLEVWGGHQIPDVYQFVSSKVAGIEPAKVKLHVMKTGGGFGRRASPSADVIAEAVMVAKALDFKHPVKVQWTREDDMRGGYYRPAYVHRLKAGLDKDGTLTAWENHIVGQSIVSGTPFEGLIQNGVDKTSVEGASNIPYAIPNIDVGLTSTTDVKVPVLWWRAVGSTHTAYAVECFLDEVAEAAGKDPMDIRMELLKNHPRHAAVLKTAADKAGWGKTLPAGHYHGLCVHESFSTMVAQVAEVSVIEGEIKVHKVVVAVDCGTAINPDVIKAQMEGGVGFGLGSILSEELNIIGGEVEDGNYDTYTPLRINEMPEVEVHIMPSTENPTGVGEPGVPPIGPALANAVYRATGKRVRALPFIKHAEI
ncbi:MAG: xanthine dehydrogenase family protein molybdopterin-binding subunit [Pseudomonadota bacterium]